MKKNKDLVNWNIPHQVDRQSSSGSSDQDTPFIAPTYLDEDYSSINIDYYDYYDYLDPQQNSIDQKQIYSNRKVYKAYFMNIYENFKQF